jgi:predicted nucleotidyltransferase
LLPHRFSRIFETMTATETTAPKLDRLVRQRGVGGGVVEPRVTAGQLDIEHRLDKATIDAVYSFMDQLKDRYSIHAAFVYGSRARGTHRADSDVDLAVVLNDPIANRFSVARDMARTAFHVMMETGLLIEAFPISVEEYEFPEYFPNPQLVETIRRDGIKM